MTTIPDRDQEALQLAIAQCRAEDADRDAQITAMLAERPWQRVAEFASHCCQSRALKLKPWQLSPCQIDVDDREHKQAAKLPREMLALYVSCFHPDPLAAIAEAKEAANR